MPSPFNTSDAADLLDVSVQRVFLKGSEKQSRMYESYYNVETGIVDYFDKDSSISGLAFAGRIVENAAVTSINPVQGFKVTYTQNQFGALLSFSKFMWFFGIKKRNIEQIVNEAIKACSDLREQRCADRLDQSFATSYTANDPSGNYLVNTVGGDSLAFISNAHTREDGGATWGNRVTDGSTINMAWEYNALKAAHRTAALILGPTGKPTNVNLDTFVCSRGFATHHRANEILGAMGRGGAGGFIPGSADRDSSGVPSYKIIPLPWIQTNTLYWWLFDSSMKGPTFGLQYRESQDIQLEGPNIVFKTGRNFAHYWRKLIAFVPQIRGNSYERA